MSSLRSLHRSTVLLLAFGFLSVLPVKGEDRGDMLDQPDILFKIVQAIRDSKIEFLTPKVDGNTSYHPTSVDYLGYVTRFGKRYYIAEAIYLRSSAQGRQMPPPRGHAALLILDAKCRIVSYGWDGDSDLRLEGTLLKCKDEPLLDFATNDIRYRHSGWPWGGALLAYPFDDRISDKDWESGAFREKDKKRAEQEKAR